MNPIKIDDNEWLEANINPHWALEKYGFHLPGLPSDEVQNRFTGRAGRDNLMQAFYFYQFCKNAVRLDKKNEPLILDFGGGWGRIARFFLKECRPENIHVADVMQESIDLLRNTVFPGIIIHNKSLPPILEIDEKKFDLIYAYSVFSHLCYEYYDAWINYFIEHLKEDGLVILTTRGMNFINYINGLNQEGKTWYGSGLLPKPTVISDKFEKKEFQFYPTGGGGELTSDYYGEAFIPPSWFRLKHGEQIVEITEDVPYVDQNIVVIKRIGL